MKNVLILDTETTGLDPSTDRVIEVAAVLYSVEHATVLRSFSCLIQGDGNAAESINRIPAVALSDATNARVVWDDVAKLSTLAEAFVAHNAEFDHSFTPEWVRRLLPWICSKTGMKWPKQTRENPSLVALALEHDLGVAYAHRAMADCDLIARLLTRSRELGADLNAMLEYGLIPRVEFQALVSYEDRGKAKDAGFQWNSGKSQWLRKMIREEAAALPFKVRETNSIGL